MKYKKHDQFYELVLPDYACPAFCSFTKRYHGTIKEVRELVETIRINNENGQHDELLHAWYEWEQGNTTVTHRPTYHECQFLTAEKIVAMKAYSFENVSWQHTNVWDSLRNLKADKVTVHQVILAQGDNYIRCIRPVFENLMVYKRHLSPPRWQPIENRFWGFPGMMVSDGIYTYPRLYVEQKSYENLNDAIRDINDFKKLDFSAICDEIFGDG